MSDLEEPFSILRNATDIWQGKMLARTAEQSQEAFTVGSGTEADPAMVPEVEVTPEDGPPRRDILLPLPDVAAAEEAVRKQFQPKQGVEAVLDALVAEQELAFGALTGNLEQDSKAPKRVPLADFMDKMGAQGALDKLVELTGSENLAASIVTLPAAAVAILVDPLNLGAAGKAGKELAKQGIKLTKKLQATFDAAQEELVKLYHGSPHKFEQFSTKNIGTGEGNQAFGHGLYFAENPQVAKEYVQGSASGTVTPIRAFKGQELEPGTPAYHAATLLETTGMTLAGVRREVKGWIANAKPGENVEHYQAVLDTLNQAKSKADFKVLKNQGHFYEAAVPRKSIDAMLDWDKPLGDQPEAVKAFMSKNLADNHKIVDGSPIDVQRIADDLELFADNTEALYKNQSVYKALKRYVQDPTNATVRKQLETYFSPYPFDRKEYKTVLQSLEHEFAVPTGELFKAAQAKVGAGVIEKQMKEAGIPGVKYLDAGSRGAAADAKATRNIVLFDEGDIRQTRRNTKTGAVEILKSERGSVQMGKAAAPRGPETIQATTPTWEEAVQLDDFQRAFDDRLKTFSERLSTQRRAVRSDVQVGLEASQLQQERLNLEGILQLEPGTILNDAEVVAVRQMFKDTAEPVRQLAAWVDAHPGDQTAFLALLRQLPNVDDALTKIAGVYAESGRTQRLLRDSLPTGGLVPADTAERVRISDPYLAQWLDFFQQQDELAKLGAPAVTKERFVSMLASMKSPEQLMKFAKAVNDPTWGDMVAEVYINGLLSGLAPVKNILGNPVVFGGQIAVRGVAAGISTARASGRWVLGNGFQKDVYFGEVGAMLRGATGSLGDAFQMAWRSMKEGRPLSRGESVEPMKRAITGDALELTGAPGRAVDFIGSTIRLPGTALLGGDELFKTMAWRAEQRALALRKAHETVNATGATGAQADRLFKDTMQSVLDHPENFPSIKETAQDFAVYVTLQQELGPMGKAVQTFASTARSATGIPVGRFIMPFTTIATNAPRMAGEHSPLAVFSRLVWDEINAGGARRDLALAKIATGTAAMMVMADLASQGIITGAGPKQKSARQARHDATGWQATSIKIGDRYVSVQPLEPWSTLMGATADLTEMYAHAETQDQRSKIEAAMVAVNYAISRNVTSKTYLMGLSGLMNAAMTGDIESWQQFANQTASGLVPFSGALRQITAANDQVIRQAVDMVDAVKKEIPGWSDDLRPLRDFWGQEVVREGGFGWDFYNPLYTSTERHDAVSLEFVRLGYFPSMPGKQIDGVPLDESKDGELDAYIRLSQGMPIIGDKTLHQRLEQMVASDAYKRSSDGPDGGKAVMLQDIIDDYRGKAAYILHSESESKTWLGKDFPDLRKQFDLVEQEKAQRFNKPELQTR